jgi:hypothetical protein
MSRAFRKIIVFIIFLIVLSSFPSLQAATSTEEEVNKALLAAESLFKAMKEKQYAEIWKSITAKTKKSIVEDVYRAAKKSGEEIKLSIIENDFQAGGELAKAYWDAYLFVFDPEMALSQSKWTIGKISITDAEINILFRKSAKPAVLRLSRENGEWKVGLTETFGARNMIPF